MQPRNVWTLANFSSVRTTDSIACIFSSFIFHAARKSATMAGEQPKMSAGQPSITKYVVSRLQ